MNSAMERAAKQVLQQRTGVQVDASVGFTAGIAEALIQSHAGEISLLSGLPTRLG